MESGSVLIEVLILLALALLLGTLAERLKQSAIVGYLLAGAIAGPNLLGWVRTESSVQLIAELGVALLLFTIGLEFSFRRLRRLGTVALGGGSLQIFITAAIVFLLAWSFKTGIPAAVALAAMIPLSSTASVLRLLTDRAALESPYGRNAMGILLLQDAAVLPLTLIVSAMSTGGNFLDILLLLSRTLLYGGIMIVAFLFVFNWLVPRLLNIRHWANNREFPILLAIIMAIGSATAAEHLSISPAIGAFLAGLLLAESPFAVQIRADVASLKTVLVTVFFASIGMLSDPMWVMHHWQLVTLVVLAVIIGKSAIVWFVLRLMRIPLGMSLATGLCLAQIGEFSFVLAQLSRGHLITEEMLRLIVSATVITLFITPYLVDISPVIAGWIEYGFRLRKLPISKATTPSLTPNETPAAQTPTPIIIIGFGPAGQRVAESLIARYQKEILVVDLNPRSAAIAERYGLAMQVGNASQPEVLETAGIHHARAVVITIPDPAASQQMIHLCRAMNPNVSVLVRARYHAYRWELQFAGAEVVVDEEEHVGFRLAAETRRILHVAD